MNDEPLGQMLSAEDEAEVKSIYRRIVTPLRCRFGFHRWHPWQYFMSMQLGAVLFASGREADPIQIDVEVRLCPACMKVQARTKRSNVEPMEEC